VILKHTAVYHHQNQGIPIMKNLNRFAGCCMLCAMLLAAGCTQNVAPPVEQTPMAKAPQDLPADHSTVMTTLSSLGTVLTDSRGMTLYFFADDIPGSGKSTCSGKCLDFWPVFYTETPIVPASLDASDFTVITRSDGTRQSVYKGWPLYYFARDGKAGDMKGESIQGNWSVAKPDYTVMYSHRPGVGTFLTDGSGQTLYYFAMDDPGATACTGSCAAAWPPFSSGTLVAPSILKRADFTGGMRPDGTPQSFYRGHALYYYSKDAKPGDMNGQGVRNLWAVADMNGTVPPVPVVTTLPLPTPSPTYVSSDSGGSTDSGGGY
jgi:predicted lipoprotein with Yx(FWY)xxD motif